MHGVKVCNLGWFESYLSNRQQFITYGNKQTNIETITCGVLQGSILAPLLFLILVNDLHKVTKYLDPIMFADNTNIFYSHKNIKTLFQIVNSELKLSLNAKKKKKVLFHKVSMCDSLPSQLPTMTFNNIEIKRKNSIKFLGAIIDENITWTNHIEVVENKNSKNIGVFYRASHLLDFKNFLKIHFSFILIYISYANIACARTFKTKLQGILKKQKHAARITFRTNRLYHARPLLKEMKALNVYQINLIQTLKFMRKTKYGKKSRIFLPKFREVDHQYSTRFSQNSFCYKGSVVKPTALQ